MDVEKEIADLKRRVGDLEGAVNVLSGDWRSFSAHLVTIEEASKGRLDGLARNVDRVVARLDTMNTQIWSLRDDLPILLGEAIRKIDPSQN